MACVWSRPGSLRREASQATGACAILRQEGGVMSSEVQGGLLLRGYDGAGAAVKTSFPLEQVLSAFRSRFESEWAKRSREFVLNEPVIVEGNFVRVD
jgi:hypothetical protein